MSLTYAPQLSSVSTSGKAVQVHNTATPGTTFHTAVSGSAAFDEVIVWAYNGHTGDVTLTLELGGTTAPNVVVQNLAAKTGLQLILPGNRFNGAVVLAAFASVADVVALYVNINHVA